MTGEMRLYAIDLRLQAIRAWAIKREFTPHRLGKSCGLGPGTLVKLMDPSWNPRVSTLRIVEQYIDDYEKQQEEQQKSFEEQFAKMTEVEQSHILDYMAELRKKR